MEILIESTKEFEQDLEKFTNREKFKVIKKLNRYVDLISKNKNLLENQAFKLKDIKFSAEYDSSLYALIIDKHLRIILTIDDDPIFDATVVTLFRVVRTEDASKAYSSIAESLYQDFSMQNQEVEVHSS
jgi:mRNA-degrading endonuclease YafQ of YafQ-DinJ toxin-antitoxin module